MGRVPVTESRDRADRAPHLRPAQGLLLLLATGLVLLGVWVAGEGIARTSTEFASAGGRALGHLLLGDVRVGIQIGHLEARAHAPEHARLRVSTGGSANGVTEVDVNRAVAEALRDILTARGIAVDLLPASVPPRYRADLLVSLHADSSPDPSRRGYKSAHFDPPRTPQERTLKALVDRSYFAATALPDDHENVSGNMLKYYAFDTSYHHSVAPVTPALLIEMGYISNRRDLTVLAAPEVPAHAIAEGVVAYLRQAGRLPSP